MQPSKKIMGVVLTVVCALLAVFIMTNAGKFDVLKVAMEVDDSVILTDETTFGLRGENPSEYYDTVTYERKKAQAAAEDKADGAGTSFVPKKVLVIFREGVSAEEATRVVVQADSVTSKLVSHDDLEKPVPVVQLDVDETVSLSSTIEELSNNPNVEFVQPNFIYTTSTNDISKQSTAIDDAYASKQWQLDNIGIYDAWDIERCDNDVAVAVFDTGIDMDHPDLQGNIIGPWDAVNNDSSPDDVMGHGTHVAGIIAAEANNGLGIAGVSYNANIMPIGVFYSEFNFPQFEYVTSSSMINAAYNHLLGSSDDGSAQTLAQEYNVRVVNMSLGALYSTADDLTKEDLLVYKSIDQAYSAGILTVCAAGNDSSDTPTFPGDYGKCVSVTSLSYDETSDTVSLASYSSFGSAKDICAPGSMVYSTWDPLYKDSNGQTGSNYSFDSGTSMASPVVAGVAVLLFSCDPSLTPDEAKEILYNTADDLGNPGLDVYYGYGRVNPTAALDYILGTVISQTALSTSAHVQSIGWMPYQGNKQVVGSTGLGLRMESIKVRLTDSSGNALPIDSLQVSAHVENIGWMKAVGNDVLCGTTGRSLRLEAMTLRLSDTLMAQGYHIYYRVHAENVGWMGWACDGGKAGTAGNSLRLEAIQIVLLAPGEGAPVDSFGGLTSATTHTYIDSSLMDGVFFYDAMVHVQNTGNVYVATNGNLTLGTTGQALRLEGVTLSLKNADGLGISYQTHIQGVGWQEERSDGGFSGTQGQALRLEAIRIKLTGGNADKYEVYYRTHVQNIGWTGWAKDGKSCGSAGYSYRMEAMQIIIVKKGSSAPGLEGGYFYER